MTHRILLVEDDPSINKLLAMTLKLNGFEVTPAGHGQEGVELLKQGRFDAVVADLFMPLMDGIHLIRWMQENGHADTPVLVMTAMVRDDVKRDAEEAGAAGVLHKPVAVDHLLAELKRVLDS